MYAKKRSFENTAHTLYSRIGSKLCETEAGRVVVTYTKYYYCSATPTPCVERGFTFTALKKDRYS